MKTIVPITTQELAALRGEPSAVMMFSVQKLLRQVRLPVRIVRRLVLPEQNDCWLITGWNSGNGFAKMNVGLRHRQVHRVIYALLHEELYLPALPPSHVLDHVKELCTARNCGNPFHLEPVTVKVNTDRGAAVLFKSKETA